MPEALKKIPWREINPRRVRYDEGEAAGYIRECFKGLESATFNLQTVTTGITSGTTDLTPFLKLAGRTGNNNAITLSSPAYIGLKIIPHPAQTANIVTIRDYTNTYNAFSIDAGSLVTISETTATDDTVRFQVRVPTTQTQNIMQVVRAFGGGNFTAWSVGSTGTSVYGDTGLNGPGVIRLQINQGNGQSVEMMRVMNTAGSGSFFSISSTGQLSLGDGTDTTKRLLFALNSSTANADLTLDYRSAVDRSLIWNLSGGTGGNLQFNWNGTSTRTVTFPGTTASVNYTLAGLQLANVFTTLQTITRTTDAQAFQINFDDSIQTVDVMRITGTTSGSVISAFVADGTLHTVAFRLWPGGSVGSGFGAGFNVSAITADRLYTFPNLDGTVLIGGATVTAVSQTASIGTTTLTAAEGLTTWLINSYLSVTTADPNNTTGSVSVTLGWTDVGGAKTSAVITRTLGSTGAQQATTMLQVQSLSNITYSTTFSPTPATSPVSTLTLTTGGTGYSTGAGQATTGGTGAGCTVNVTAVSGGVITAISSTPTAAGTGYTAGDVLTISTGGANATVTVSAVNNGIYALYLKATQL